MDNICYVGRGFSGHWEITDKEEYVIKMIVVHEQLRKCIYSEEKIQNGEVVLERKKNKKCGAI